jgi:hypothetical protein
MVLIILQIMNTNKLNPFVSLILSSYFEDKYGRSTHCSSERFFVMQIIINGLVIVHGVLNRCLANHSKIVVVMSCFAFASCRTQQQHVCSIMSCCHQQGHASFF